MQLTHNQVIHRAYLASPVWKSKRAEALAFYGCICNRCKEYGNDVHHKTYERVGGNELMKDLEVLCRDCHTAHHKLERKARKIDKTKPKTIHRRLVYISLTEAMKDNLCKEFSIPKGQLFASINYGSDEEVRRRAAFMLGCNRVLGLRNSYLTKRNSRYLSTIQ